MLIYININSSYLLMVLEYFNRTVVFAETFKCYELTKC